MNCTTTKYFTREVKIKEKEDEGEIQTMVIDEYLDSVDEKLNQKWKMFLYH